MVHHRKYPLYSLTKSCIYKKISTWPLTLGWRSHESLRSTVYIMWPVHLQILKLLRPTFLEELAKNTFFDIWPCVKVTWNNAQYPLHEPAKFEVAMSNG